MRLWCLGALDCDVNQHCPDLPACSKACMEDVENVPLSVGNLVIEARREGKAIELWKVRTH